MRPAIVVLLLLIGGVWAAAAYRENSAKAGLESAPPVVASKPAVRPLSLEERAAAAQGTTLPAEARRSYPPRIADELVERADAAAPTAQYRCDGRSYCPEMHSCEEARWFLQHCPGMHMDGNGDGVPCERQWCQHSFSR